MISLKYKSLAKEELNRRKIKLSTSLKNRSDEDKAKTLNKRRMFYQSHYGVDCFAQTHEGHVKSKKKYIHNGIKFDSKLEIAIYDYCIENGIEVIYQPKSLEYYVNGKLHIYHPDFLINGKLYEAKGAHLLKDGHLFFPFRSKLSEAELKRIDIVYEAKEKCMRDNNVTIISNDDIDNLKNIFIL